MTTLRKSFSESRKDAEVAKEAIDASLVEIELQRKIAAEVERVHRDSVVALAACKMQAAAAKEAAYVSRAQANETEYHLEQMESHLAQ